jgi:hypothetical protein
MNSGRRKGSILLLDNDPDSPLRRITVLCEGNAQVHVFSVREAAEKCGMSEEL